MPAERDRAGGRRGWPVLGAVLAGSVGAIGCLLATIVPGLAAAALRGWLAAVSLVASAAAGALVLTAMMRLIPGAWTGALGRQTAGFASATIVLPLLAVPVLAGGLLLYPPPEHAGAWHWPAVVAGRSLLLLVMLAVLGPLLARSRSPALACAVLLVVPCAVTVLADDALLARDPQAESSGFGLWILSLGTTAAIAAAILLTDLRDKGRKATLAAGGLLLTTVLLSAYFAFLPYFIVWSGNRPDQVTFYAERAGAWSALLWAWTLGLGLALSALLLVPVLRSARALSLVSGLVLAAIVAQWAWLVLPAGGRGPGLPDLGFWLLASASLAALAIASGLLLGPRHGLGEGGP